MRLNELLPINFKIMTDTINDLIGEVVFSFFNKAIYLGTDMNPRSDFFLQ